MSKKTTKGKAKATAAAAEEVPTLPTGEITLSKVEVMLPPLPAEAGINVTFTSEELVTFTNLLNMSSLTFKALANSAQQQNDEKTYEILSARQKLSAMLAFKLASFNDMGEPTSRDLH
jgi:plastocyanin domain-containing protein